jgi:cytochrome b6-f complex iron-sulfur subunit
MYNNRRGFLRWLALGFGSLVGWLPGFTRRRFALAKGKRTASGSKASEPEFVKKASEPEFVKVATLADLKDGPFKVENAFGKNTATLWLVGDPQKEDSLLALDATCPHEGCDVNWRGENFVCPCHGAAFAADGSRTRGPAKADLAIYKVKVEKGEIFVAKAS